MSDWNEHGGGMLHLLGPGERVLAFEDIAVIDGMGVPKPLGRPGSKSRHTSCGRLLPLR